MNGEKYTLAVFIAILAASSVLTIGLPAATAQTERSPNAGEEAPPFTAKTLAGETVSLEDYRGKILVLDFYSVDCPHCQTAAEHLRSVRDNFSRENVAILSVEVDSRTSTEDMRGFKSEYGGDWTFAKSPETADNYNVEGIPTILIVDPTGYIVFRSSGTVPAEVINSICHDVLGNLSPPDNEPSDRAGENDLPTNQVIAVNMDPENAGGIVSTSLKIRENGTPVFTYEVEASPGYEFVRWTGNVPENVKNRKEISITPSPGTELTAKFERIKPAETEEGRTNPSRSDRLSSEKLLLIGTGIGCLIGALGGYAISKREALSADQNKKNSKSEKTR